MTGSTGALDVGNPDVATPDSLSSNWIGVHSLRQPLLTIFLTKHSVSLVNCAITRRQRLARTRGRA